MAISAETSERADADGRGPRRPRSIAVTIVLSVLAAAAIGPSALLLGPLYLAAVSGELVRIDIESRRLPNRLVLPGYPISLTGIAVHGVLSGASPVPALVMGVTWFGFFLLLNLGGGMGMGDVKLAGVLGLCLGSLSPGSALAGLACAFLFGGVAAVVMLARRVGGKEARIPFGPFLLAGFWVAVALTPALATSAA